jgi:hypothetical protein
MPAVAVPVGQPPPSPRALVALLMYAGSGRLRGRTERMPQAPGNSTLMQPLPRKSMPAQYQRGIGTTPLQ